MSRPSAAAASCTFCALAGNSLIASSAASIRRCRCGRRASRARPSRIATRRARRRSDRDCRRPVRHASRRSPRPTARRPPECARRPVEPHQLLLVVMPVQQQLGAVLGEHRAQHRRIDQPLHVVAAGRDRRMVDQHHAKHRLARERDQDLGEPRELFAAEPSGRHERPGRQRGRQPDDRDRPAPAHEREVAPSSPRMKSPQCCAACPATRRT